MIIWIEKRNIYYFLCTFAQFWIFTSWFVLGIFLILLWIYFFRNSRTCYKRYIRLHYLWMNIIYNDIKHLNSTDKLWVQRYNLKKNILFTLSACVYKITKGSLVHDTFIVILNIIKRNKIFCHDMTHITLLM